MGDTVSTLLFQPPPPSKLKEHKIVWLTTSRGKKIPGFYISYRRQGGVESCRSLSADEIKDSQPEEGITILYSHANAEDLGSIYPWCKFLSKMLQVNLFAYDYTGYGMAMDCGACGKITSFYRFFRKNHAHHCLLVPVCHFTGPPSEDDCYADIEAAYAYLTKTLRVLPQNIVLYGRSLGSGPSCHLAALSAASVPPESSETAVDGPVGGLILHAPFLSVYRVVLDTGCTLVGDKFPNCDIISMVASPTILIHGTSDQIVPFHHSERLYENIMEKFRTKPLYIEGMSHNNVHAQVRPMFVDRLREYLETHVWSQAVVRKRTPASFKTRPRSTCLVDDE